MASKSKSDDIKGVEFAGVGRVGAGSSGVGLPSTDRLSLNLQFATDKSLTARKGPTPTFTRASGATFVNNLGQIKYARENLFFPSELLTNAPTNVTLSRVTGDTVIASPVFLAETAATGLHRVFTSGASNDGLTVCSYILKGAGRDFVFINGASGHPSNTFNLSAGTFTNNTGWTAVNLGSGWWRISTPPFTSLGTSNAAIQINSSSLVGDTIYTGDITKGILIGGVQKERHEFARAYIPTTTAAVYNARFDHDPVTLACKGLLIEEARTNLTIRSDDFGASEWNQLRNLTVTANNTASPSGATDADLLTVGATTTTYQVAQALPATGNVTSGTTYTVSCYFKPNQVTRVSIWAGNPVTLPVDAMFDLTGAGSVVASAFGTASIQQVGNGWYRCIVTGTAGATSNTTLRFSPVSGTSRTYVGNSVDSFWAWGAQLEAGSFPTSYIPTTSASVVRSADVCSITGSDFTLVYNESEHTLFAEASGMSHANFGSYLSFDNETAEQSALAGFPSPNSATCYVIDGAGTQASVGKSITLNQNNKLAAAMKASSFQVAANGSLGTEDTSGTMPTATIFKIGRSWNNNTTSGTYSQIKVFKKRLSNAKLQALTV
jgi:hypothetical protein